MRKLLAITVGLLLIGALACGLTSAKTTTTWASAACGDGTDWTEVALIPDVWERAKCGNGQAVDCQAAEKTSDCLRASAFGFSLPSAAVVTNVEVSVKRKAGSTDGDTKYARDYTLYLAKAGVASGDNKADTGTNWPTDFTAKSYSYTPAQWNMAITAADVNDTDFGFILAVAEKCAATETQSAVVVDTDADSSYPTTITITYRYGQKVYSVTNAGKVDSVDTLNAAKVAGASGT